jgi:hypothetical protein
VSVQCLHVSSVTKEVARLLRAAHLGAGLDVKRVLYGALEYSPVPKTWLAANVPIIFASPTDASYSKPILGTSGRWETTISIRIVHVMKTAGGLDVWENKVAAAESLAQTLLENYGLTALTLTNGQVLDTRLRRVELKPPEDDFAFAADESLTVQAIVFEVVVTGIRNTA